MLSAIVCMDNFGGIGKNGDLLYKIPEDIKRFKELTMGHWVIMGRKTWNSIGNKPLPGRTNIVISNTLNFSMAETNKYTGYKTSVNIWKDITEEKIKFYVERPEEYFVIGGQSIYEMFLPYCNKVYATVITKLLNTADTYFPINDLVEKFDCISDEEYDNGELIYHFREFVKSEGRKHSNELPRSIATRVYTDPISGHDAVKNPSHYTSGKYPVIDFIEDQGLGYCLGNVIKYICRAGKKYPGDKQKELQDLNKAKWYLERRLEEHKNGIEQDSGNFKAEIKITDFIEDQKLNYARGEILRYAVSFEKPDDLEVYPKIALALLDAEIHRMEEQL